MRPRFVLGVIALYGFSVPFTASGWIDGDLCAIGFKCGNRLVYLSSYNMADGKTEGYDYDFELLNETEPYNLMF